MAAIKKQLIARRRPKPKLSAKRLAFLALQDQLEQRILQEQYKSAHRLHRRADQSDHGEAISIRWARGRGEDLLALREFVDRHLRADWFEREAVLRDKLIRGHISLLGFHGEILVAWACKSLQDVLQNLLIHPAYRGAGIGQRAVALMAPQIIRSKSDQSTGDPESFYRRSGFIPSGKIAGRKRNINIMIAHRT